MLKPDGAVAWIGSGHSIGTRVQLIEVRKLDSQGAALLDSGSAVAGGSLRLRRSTLTWRDGSGTRTATLH